ncbi:MAG: sulfotransferase [Fimbriimonas sp.]|nr:sulfotransferase [Fimbriimonas sp.]
MEDRLVAIAERAFKSGDLATAERTCRDILALRRDNPQAILLTGLIAIRKGNHAEGEQWLQKSLGYSPDDYVALLWLPIALRALGRPMEAIKIGERSRALWPQSAEVLTSLALDYFNVKDYSNAERCLQDAAKYSPGDPSIPRKLGSLYEAMGRDAEAADAYRRAVEIAPRWEEGYTYLGRLLVGHGNFTQAIEICETALNLLPQSAQIHLILAQALRGVREVETAGFHLERAIELDPRIVLAAALWLNEDGRFEESAKLFKRSIEDRPRQGVAYFGLVKTRKINRDDNSLIDAMAQLVEEGGLPDKELAALQYALGKSHDDLGDYGEAIVHFDAANALRYRIYLQGKDFDREASILHREQTERMLSSSFLDERRHVSSSSDVPIFVVGMIRSGTTLLEQIIASHPDVGGAGEQRFWVSEIASAVDVAAGRFDEARFAELIDRYLQVLRSLQPDSRRVTDKMPMNFYCAGLLHLAFPNSPIVHIKRHPVDTALSIYMTDLAKPPEFAHDRDNIVFAYREYEKIMDFWRSVIPGSSFLEIRYEDLVDDTPYWARKVIEFCGLEWDPACLDFHRNERQVSTPSMWQVRQPIYRTSVEKWRRYEPWLGSFRELLR